MRFPLGGLALGFAGGRLARGGGFQKSLSVSSCRLSGSVSCLQNQSAVDGLCPSSACAPSRGQEGLLYQAGRVSLVPECLLVAQSPGSIWAAAGRGGEPGVRKARRTKLSALSSVEREWCGRDHGHNSENFFNSHIAICTL